MKKASIVKKAIPVVVVVVLITGGYFGYNAYRNATKGAPAMQTFSASGGSMFEIASRSELREILTATGIVALSSEDKVYSEGSGKVSEVLVAIGDTVTTGQTIATFNTEDTIEDLQKQLLEAQINLSNQMLTLKSMTLPVSDSETKKLTDNIKTAEKSVTNAERTIADKEKAITEAQANYDITYEKIENYKQTLEKLSKAISDNEKLLSVGGISQEVYNKSVEEYNNALLTMAEYNKTLAQNEKAIEDAKIAVADAVSSLADAQLSLEDANKELNDSQVTLKEESDRINYEKQKNQVSLSEMNVAKIEKELAKVIEATHTDKAGTVTAVNIDEKVTVTDQTHVITVADFSKLIVKADVSEYDAPKLEIGQRVEMTSDGLSDVVFEGTLTSIGNSAVTKSVSGSSESVVEIEVSLNTIDNRIKPGFTLDMDIIVVDKDDVINISIAALQKDRETKENYVFVIDESNVLHKTAVTTGVYGDMNVEITQGLTEGMRIIKSPTTAMTDGMVLDMSSFIPTERNGSTNREQGGFMPNMSGGMGGNAVRVESAVRIESPR